MKLLVITYPHEIANEADKINLLFEEGLELLHLRKPDWSLESYEALLKGIASKYYKRVVIHSHFKLIEKYNLKGVHFRSQYLSGVGETNIKEVFRLAGKKNITISASMHSFQEIEENKWKFDYVFLSPLFDSISKKGYSSGFEPETLKEFMKKYHAPMKIIALGGINEVNIEKVADYGFSGAALLGAIWNEGESVGQFRKIKNLIEV